MECGEIDEKKMIAINNNKILTLSTLVHWVLNVTS